MKRVICIVAMVLCGMVVVNAQDAAQKPKSQQAAQPLRIETIHLEAPAQQELAELQRQATEYRVASEAAAARYDAAQQKVVTAIYKAMAEAGCSPKACQIRQSQQEGIYFERTVPAEPAAVVVPGKPAPPAKP